MSDSVPPLGLVEGHYGRPWTWPQRSETVLALARHGYSFHLHAPKAAAWLRRRWREPVGEQEAAEVAAHASACERAGIAFGFGLSPHAFEDATAAGDWARLRDKLTELAALGGRWLALLFDDIQGDDPTLAGRQRRIVDACLERGGFERLLVCPTYYSDDLVLDRVFGPRPSGYLAHLTAGLPADVEVFWTGPEVCSREITPAHLREVTGRLGRPPTLWDNYPVNDGPRMSQVLHLRAFVGRPAGNAGLMRGHAINPALQPVLTRIPAITLAARYRIGEDDWCGARALAEACTEVLGPALGRRVREDLIALQDTGRDRLGARLGELRARYAGDPHPGAAEIVAWLDGAFEITDEIVRTQ